MSYPRMMMSVAASVLLAGCSIPHNDVLVFGTQTMFALDASSAPEQGGVPQFTLGYKRKELVWMPMIMNGICSRAATDRLPAACLPSASANDETPGSNVTATSQAAQTDSNAKASQGASPMYQGKGEPDRDWLGGGVDAYSVFASFGAKAGGSASVAEAGGQAELAQFFATGIAAQRLAANQKAPDLVSLQNPSAKVVDEAIETAIQGEIARRGSDVDRLISEVQTDGNFDVTKWNALVDKAKGGLAARNYEFLKEVTSEAQARDELRNKREKIDPLINALNAE